MSTGKIPKCEICGVRDAEFVCRRCGRLVCRFDYDFELGVCKICAEELRREGKTHVYKMFESIDLLSWILIFIGIFIIFFGGFLMTVGSTYTPTINQSFVIIWPLPIVFTGSYAFIIGIIFLIVMIAIVIWIIRKFTSIS